MIPLAEEETPEDRKDRIAATLEAALTERFAGKAFTPEASQAVKDLAVELLNAEPRVHGDAEWGAMLVADPQAKQYGVYPYRKAARLPTEETP